MSDTVFKYILLQAFCSKFAWTVKSIAFKLEEIGQIFFFKLLFYKTDIWDITGLADVNGAS